MGAAPRSHSLLGPNTTSPTTHIREHTATLLSCAYGELSVTHPGGFVRPASPENMAAPGPLARRVPHVGMVVGGLRLRFSFTKRVTKHEHLVCHHRLLNPLLRLSFTLPATAQGRDTASGTSTNHAVRSRPGPVFHGRLAPPHRHGAGEPGRPLGEGKPLPFLPPRQPPFCSAVVSSLGGLFTSTFPFSCLFDPPSHPTTPPPPACRPRARRSCGTTPTRRTSSGRASPTPSSRRR